MERELKHQVKLIAAVVVVSFLLVPLPFVSSSEIYTWKDKDGKIIYSDTPPPPGVQMQIKKFSEDSVERPAAKDDASRPQGKQVAEKRQRDVSVIMYMTAWCPYCQKAREYIKSLNVRLIEYNIEKDASRKEEMLRKSGGSTGVPVIDVEGIIIKGYSPEAIRGAIEKRRNL